MSFEGVTSVHGSGGFWLLWASVSGQSQLLGNHAGPCVRIESVSSPYVTCQCTPWQVTYNASLDNSLSVFIVSLSLGPGLLPTITMSWSASLNQIAPSMLHKFGNALGCVCTAPCSVCPCRYMAKRSRVTTRESCYYAAA